MVGGLITICGGILAASGFFVSRTRNAQQLIDKLTPYQGWIGIVMFGWGVWETIQSVTSVGMLSVAPLQWVFWLCVAIADLLVGFLLGFGLITKYALSKSPAARTRGENIRAKLAPYQGLCGLFAITMGALYIVWPYVA